MLRFKKKMTISDHGHHLFNVNAKCRRHSALTAIKLLPIFGFSYTNVPDGLYSCHSTSLHLANDCCTFPHPRTPDKKTHLSAVKSHKFELKTKHKTKQKLGKSY